MFQRARKFAFPLLLGVGFLYWIWRAWFFQGPDRPDLRILLLAAERMAAGVNPYQLSDWAEQTKPPLVTFAFQAFLFLPRAFALGLWDLISWASLVGLLAAWAGPGRDQGFRMALIWLCAVGTWWAEMRLGQYNFPLVACAYFVPLWVHESSRSIGRLLILGGFGAACFLLKPTSLLLFPWMVSGVLRDSRKLMLSFWGAGLVFGLGFLGLSLQQGFEGAFSAHREWLAFLPLSEAKHLLRGDNLGLPTFFARHLGWGVPSGVFLLIGAAIAGAVSWCFPLSRWAFALSVFLSVVCSPMAWRQNFGPLYLVIGGLWVQSFRKASPLFHGLLGLTVVAFQVAGSDLLGVVGFEFFNRSGLALALAIFASGSLLFICRPSRNGVDRSVSFFPDSGVGKVHS